MPFSTLFERLRMIEEIRRAAAALRARFDRHSDIDLAVKGLASEHFFKACAFLIHELSGNHDLDLKPYEDLDENLRRRIDGEGIRIE